MGSRQGDKETNKPMPLMSLSLPFFPPPTTVTRHDPNIQDQQQSEDTVMRRNLGGITLECGDLSPLSPSPKRRQVAALHT